MFKMLEQKLCARSDNYFAFGDFFDYWLYFMSLVHVNLHYSTMMSINLLHTFIKMQEMTHCIKVLICR